MGGVSKKLRERRRGWDRGYFECRIYIATNGRTGRNTCLSGASTGPNKKRTFMVICKGLNS